MKLSTSAAAVSARPFPGCPRRAGTLPSPRSSARTRRAGRDGRPRSWSPALLVSDRAGLQSGPARHVSATLCWRQHRALEKNPLVQQSHREEGTRGHPWAKSREAAPLCGGFLVAPTRVALGVPGRKHPAFGGDRWAAVSSNPQVSDPKEPHEASPGQVRPRGHPARTAPTAPRQLCPQHGQGEPRRRLRQQDSRGVPTPAPGPADEPGSDDGVEGEPVNRSEGSTAPFPRAKHGSPQPGPAGSKGRSEAPSCPPLQRWL